MIYIDARNQFRTEGPHTVVDILGYGGARSDKFSGQSPAWPASAEKDVLVSCQVVAIFDDFMAQTVVMTHQDAWTDDGPSLFRFALCLYLCLSIDTHPERP